MMSDASDMLAAALEQMDGIIAGKIEAFQQLPNTKSDLKPSIPNSMVPPHLNLTKHIGKFVRSVHIGNVLQWKCHRLISWNLTYFMKPYL